MLSQALECYRLASATLRVHWDGGIYHLHPQLARDRWYRALQNYGVSLINAFFSLLWALLGT